VLWILSVGARRDHLPRGLRLVSHPGSSPRTKRTSARLRALMR
jgi:hypothetical protein